MKHGILATLLLCTAGLAAGDTTSHAPIFGFLGDGVAREADLETSFDRHLSATDLHDWAKRLSSRPHHVGSAASRQNAEWIAEQLRGWGYDTRIERFDVLFPTPKTRRVELLSPRKYRAVLAEPALKEDTTSGQKDEQLPTYNAYSIDGDVTGELVYVNYGIPADYEELERRGIDVKGKIVIARYYGSWRGIKPKVAAEKGAIGCLIYTDPRDDGYFQGDSYPVGGYRSAESVQRGSVADMPVYPGDPLTPGVGATDEAKRLSLDEAQTLTKIPVLPLSWADAQPLLEALLGPVAPEAWRGALPITYHIGPGPAKVRLEVASDWKTVPAFDVIATIRGTDYPDEWVLRGNHHDAWVNGATDPVSGMVAVMAEAKAIGALVKGGFRPRRTIVFAAWDGEEPGLLGSVEWAERHAAELRDKAVVYVNSDSNSRGYLYMGGSHSLERFMTEVARDVDDPRVGGSVGARQRAGAMVFGDADARARALGGEPVRLEALGSGSDYTPFLQHLGIASLNIGFGGEDQYGQYHSIYDSFDHYVRFMDPDFAYGVALARVGGRAVLRLAQADVLPFDFTAFAATVGRYVDEIEKLAEKMRKETDERSRMLDAGAFTATAPPDETRLPPPRQDAVPFFNLAPLHNAAARLDAAARVYAGALGHAAADDARRESVNEILMKTERALTSDAGLPGRHWFRHLVYAPGFYTGYGVKTLPAVREAIEQRQWGRVDAGVTQTAAALEATALEIEKAARALDGSSAKP